MTAPSASQVSEPEWGDLREAIDVIAHGTATGERPAAEKLFRGAFASWGERGYGRYWMFPTDPRLMSPRHAGSRWLEHPQFDFATSAIALPLFPDRAIGPEEGTPPLFHRVVVDLSEIRRRWPPRNPATRPQPRYAGDQALIEEGIQAIREGTAANASQAEHLVVARAQGNSLESNHARLRRAIGPVSPPWHPGDGR